MQGSGAGRALVKFGNMEPAGCLFKYVIININMQYGI